MSVCPAFLLVCAQPASLLPLLQPCSFDSRVFLPYLIIHSRLCSLSVVIIQPSPLGIQIPHTLL